MSDVRIVGDKPMKLYCDNKAAINIDHNPTKHDCTKHIEIDRLFIKEKLNEGFICMPYITSKKQLVNVFTKGLSSKVFYALVCKLNTRDIYALT